MADQRGAGSVERVGCPGNARHWFTRYGAPTYRLSRCVRCGAPNPKWSKERPDMVSMIGEDEVAADEVALDAHWNRKAKA